MNTRRQSSAQRRVALVREIALERERTALLIGELRTQLALAGLGLAAARLLGRSRRLRLLALGCAAAIPLLTRLLAARR